MMKTFLKISLLLAFILTLVFCKKEKEDLSLLTSDEALKTCVITDTSSVIEIFKIVEEMPRFVNVDCEALEFPSQKKKCADEELLRFIKDNINYPEIAIENNIEGEVAVLFLVNTTGCHSEIRIVKDIGYGCGIELQKLISLLPNFTPGKQRGKEVYVQYVVHYEFKL